MLAIFTVKSIHVIVFSSFSESTEATPSVIIDSFEEFR